MVREFKEYTSLSKSLGLLRSNARVWRRRELVPLGLASGRVLYEDILSRYDIPSRDSSHMDGFAVLSSDLSGASPSSPVRAAEGGGRPALGEPRPRRPLERGEALLAVYSLEGSSPPAPTRSCRWRR